ncbi:MAG: hypothetical protein HKN00_03480 [Flavobacteriaceae bacterium]|nr:hypothetical protein [Bacteroidia bacterium]MBT8287296.1 hypothetical protein [Bacteroidia bacterium]NNF74223.1 hypothetical protein [Flavobacteriaceae bacterium]NNK71733.1 hypothetical protein [Flavobacteriaceae bacterium]
MGYFNSMVIHAPLEDVLRTLRWESEKEGGVADFCNPTYHALLQDLKQHYSN